MLLTPAPAVVRPRCRAALAVVGSYGVLLSWHSTHIRVEDQLDQGWEKGVIPPETTRALNGLGFQMFRRRWWHTVLGFLPTTADDSLSHGSGSF